MLVLGRHEEQAIRIGPDIRIMVVRIEGDYVRIGIDAPQHVNIVREELLTDIKHWRTSHIRLAEGDDA